MKKTLFAPLLAAVMIFTFAATALAAPATFSDVPTSHWAYADIQALAEGKLVNGMGDGTFHPDDTLTIAQMATIIANAKGTPVGTKEGKWYYVAVENAIEADYLDKFTTNIADGTYEEPCSRDIAVFMVIEGLGIKPGAQSNGKTYDDIPDIAYSQCREQVLKAVQYGIINGVDEKGNFAPNDNLTRAQICAILNRAGYTTAAERAESIANGMTNKEIYDAIKATGKFTETDGSDNGWALKVLTAKDRKYANLQVTYQPESNFGDFLEIKAAEFDESLVYDSNLNILKEDGSVFCSFMDSNYYDSNGKFVPPSGLSYNSRQLLQEVLKIAFPDDHQKVVNALKSVLLPPYSYTGYERTPSKMMWLNGRAVLVEGNKGYKITLATLNETEWYNKIMRYPVTSSPGGYQDDRQDGNFIDVKTAYELDKW